MLLILVQGATVAKSRARPGFCQTQSLPQNGVSVTLGYMVKEQKIKPEWNSQVCRFVVRKPASALGRPEKGHYRSSILKEKVIWGHNDVCKRNKKQGISPKRSLFQQQYSKEESNKLLRKSG